MAQLLAQQFEVNGAAAILAATPAPALLAAALATLPAVIQSRIENTRHLTPILRDGADGWAAAELRYTPHQPVGRGRPRAIDFHHPQSGVGLELELSLQTVYAHDLLKLETAFANGLIQVGVVLTASKRYQEHQGFQLNPYLSFEHAAEMLRVYGPAFDAPIVILGFE